jgi:sugar lactone lactonase YvrE
MFVNIANHRGPLQARWPLRLGVPLYFTDPPYGLPKADDDPAKELKFNGVFRLVNGKVEAVIRDLTRPNGIALSPDEKTLYIANSDENRKVWMRYDGRPTARSVTEKCLRM